MQAMILRQIDAFDQALFYLKDDEQADASMMKQYLSWQKRLSQLALDFNENKGYTYDLDHLRTLNHSLYQELLPQNYATSFVNPVFAQHELGQVGIALSSIMYTSKKMVKYAHKGDFKAIANANKFALALYEVYEEDMFTLDIISELVKGDVIEHAEEAYVKAFRNNMQPDHDFYTKQIMSCDLSSPNYLYAFGDYVTDHEERTAAFLNSFDQDRITTMAQSIVEAYVNGFVRDGKDMSLRHTVRMVGILGQERLTRAILIALETKGLKGHVSSLESTAYNKQVAYDHKFDQALYMDEETLEEITAAMDQAGQLCQDFMTDYSGILYIEKFGEVPFSPQTNDARFTLSPDQNALYQKEMTHYRQLIEKYVPETERSFCIVAYPTPEIGDQFEAIFDDICKINALDSQVYEGIQQTIIQALDLGTHVHIKGVEGNETDITVQLHTLTDPQKQTNFVNCVADVNIPVGEVFTSPVLEGTNGTLHVEDIYLNDFRFLNLKLTFKDGMVDTYTCSNFEAEEDNVKFVEENLLFPHKSLPIGEFAIGTNTLAYVIANKYQIQDKLPILIIEKMGPHFAIGDTCFSFAEDHPVYNPMDNKEIIARTNSFAEVRHTDMAKAYTNVHTDITLPYDSLDAITILGGNQPVKLIEKGRFVLDGTTELNKPFEA